MNHTCAVYSNHLEERSVGLLQIYVTQSISVKIVIASICNFMATMYKIRHFMIRINFGP